MEPSNKTTPRVERLVGKFRLPGCLRQRGTERIAKIRKYLAGFKESRKGSASENSLGVNSREAGVQAQTARDVCPVPGLFELIRN